MSGRKVVFVDDDVRVIRKTELLRLYEIAGDQRTVAKALGVSPATICRALGHEKPPVAEDRLAAVIAALDGEASK